MPGLPNPVQHLADNMEVYVIEADLTQGWTFTDLLCCQHFYTHVKIGQFTNGMPNDWTTFIKTVWENILKIKWQDRISDTEVMKKVVMQSVHIPLKLTQL